MASKGHQFIPHQQLGHCIRQSLSGLETNALDFDDIAFFGWTNIRYRKIRTNSGFQTMSFEIRCYGAADIYKSRNEAAMESAVDVQVVMSDGEREYNCGGFGVE